MEAIPVEGSSLTSCCAGAVVRWRASQPPPGRSQVFVTQLPFLTYLSCVCSSCWGGGGSTEERLRGAEVSRWELGSSMHSSHSLPFPVLNEVEARNKNETQKNQILVPALPVTHWVILDKLCNHQEMEKLSSSSALLVYENKANTNRWRSVTNYRLYQLVLYTNNY